MERDTPEGERGEPLAAAGSLPARRPSGGPSSSSHQPSPPPLTARSSIQLELEEEDDEEDGEWAAAARDWAEEDEVVAYRARMRTLVFALVDAAAQPAIQLLLTYPLHHLALRGMMALESGRRGVAVGMAWPGAMALTLSLTPAGLYRGFLPLALSTALGGLAENATPLLLRALTGQQPGVVRRLLVKGLGRTIALVPQLLLEKAWTRLLVERGATVLGALRSAAVEAPLFSLTGGILGVPFWVAASRLLWNRPVQLVKRMLPPGHPLADSRMLQMPQVQLPPSLSRVWPLPTWPLPIAYLPLADFLIDADFFKQQLRRTASCMVPGLMVGVGPWYAARAAYRRARRGLMRGFFEGTETRLARRLSHATDTAPRLRGRVNTGTLLERLASAPPRLERRPTLEMHLQAARGLEPKRKRLLRRVERHLQGCTATQPPEVASCGARLIVRRDNIAASLRYVAHVPALALLAGKVRICFVGEPGQDDGGVFREYMSLLAAALSASSLLEPAPDGGLLPAAGQASKQRRALACTRELEVTVTKPGANTRLGIALAVCEPVREPRIQSLPAGFPAAESGLLQVGDAVLSVNGCVVPPCRSSRQAIELFRAAGKDVTLGVRRAAESFNPAWREELFAVGRLLALGIISECPLDVKLSRCLFKLLLDERITAADVSRIDPLFAQHRVEAVLRPGGVAAVEEALCSELMFTGVPREHDAGGGVGGGDEHDAGGVGEPLLEGGREMRVTEENKRQYVALLIEHFLVGFCREELAILVEGFHDLIPPHVLREPAGQPGRLSAIELELIVAGLPGIDVDDWRQHTAWRVAGHMAASANQKLREWFWAAVKEMEVDQRARLLSFACGSGRLPAAGFKALRPHFTVKVMAAVEPENLPTAHTCINCLCVPNYGSFEEMQQRLLRVIDEEVGFGFA